MAERINECEINNLQKMTREELVAEIINLRNKLSLAQPIDDMPMNSNPEVKLEKKTRKIDFEKYVFQRVALKICYCGWNYHGYASQDNLSCVENSIFEAFKKVNLIGDNIDMKYSRCGRTDAGVSASAQVISCIIRANRKKDQILTEYEMDDLDDRLYIFALNNVLPNDIRIVAWCRVDENFSARFSCLSRTYKYFIPSEGVNIEIMNKAAQLFLGNHDFRNFCKISPGNPQKHFLRTVLDIFVSEVDPKTCALVVKGNAFLHNQIRCMAYILITIGLGYEDSTIITHLLDVQNCPDKPIFPPVSGIPLLLFESEFNGIRWRSPSPTNEFFLVNFKYSSVELSSKLRILDSIRLVSGVKPNQKPALLLMPDPKCFKVYIPIMKRNKCLIRSKKIQKMLN